MKRQALEEVIDKHINSIEKYCNRLPGSFNQEDIHDLRVDHKKIRAFIRLLQLEKDAGELLIPDKLKAVYQISGKVRDMQLFLVEMNALPVVSNLPGCMARWRKDLFSFKEHTVSAIEDVSFKKIRSSITNELPRELFDDTVNKFLHQKVAAIHIILLAASDEHDLHATRKQLKDVIYNMRIFENDWGIPFPVNGFSEKQLSEMASQLGDFNDRCIAISLLQSGYSPEINDNEKAVLNELQASWLQQKNAQQQQLLQQVKELKMEHSF